MSLYGAVCWAGGWVGAWFTLYTIVGTGFETMVVCGAMERRSFAVCFLEIIFVGCLKQNNFGDNCFCLVLFLQQKLW